MDRLRPSFVDHATSTQYDCPKTSDLYARPVHPYYYTDFSCRPEFDSFYLNTLSQYRSFNFNQMCLSRPAHDRFSPLMHATPTCDYYYDGSHNCFFQKTSLCLPGMSSGENTEQEVIDSPEKPCFIESPEYCYCNCERIYSDGSDVPSSTHDSDKVLGFDDVGQMISKENQHLVESSSLESNNLKRIYPNENVHPSYVLQNSVCNFGQDEIPSKSYPTIDCCGYYSQKEIRSRESAGRECAGYGSRMPYRNIARESEGKRHDCTEEDSNTGSKDNSKLRKSRTTYNFQQLKILEETFAQMPYPNILVRLNIARRVNLTEDRVQNWFQNKRSRLRRDEKKMMSFSTTPSTTSYTKSTSIIQLNQRSAHRPASNMFMDNYKFRAASCTPSPTNLDYFRDCEPPPRLFLRDNYSQVGQHLSSFYGDRSSIQTNNNCNRLQQQHQSQQQQHSQQQQQQSQQHQSQQQQQSQQLYCCSPDSSHVECLPQTGRYRGNENYSRETDQESSEVINLSGFPAKYFCASGDDTTGRSAMYDY